MPRGLVLDEKVIPGGRALPHIGYTCRYALLERVIGFQAIIILVWYKVPFNRIAHKIPKSRTISRAFLVWYRVTIFAKFGLVKGRTFANPMAHHHLNYMRVPPSPGTMTNAYCRCSSYWFLRHAYGSWSSWLYYLCLFSLWPVLNLSSVESCKTPAEVKSSTDSRPGERKRRGEGGDTQSFIWGNPPRCSTQYSFI